MNTKLVAKSPKFFFDVFDGIELTSDNTGRRLCSLDSAIAEAKHLLFQIGTEMTGQDGNTDYFVAVVRTESGKKIFEACLAYQCKVIE